MQLHTPKQCNMPTLPSQIVLILKACFSPWRASIEFFLSFAQCSLDGFDQSMCGVEPLSLPSCKCIRQGVFPLPQSWCLLRGGVQAKAHRVILCMHASLNLSGFGFVSSTDHLLKAWARIWKSFFRHIGRFRREFGTLPRRLGKQCEHCFGEIML